MRRYGRWAGDAKGAAEDPERCVVEVVGDVRFHQCGRKRGYGPDRLYCAQHADMLRRGAPLSVPVDLKEEDE